MPKITPNRKRPAKTVVETVTVELTLLEVCELLNFYKTEGADPAPRPLQLMMKDLRALDLTPEA